MMSQHFLLSAAARTLSLAKVMRLSDADAYDTFKQVRWEKGEPVCPQCGGVEPYEITTRKLFKCRACRHQFSVTSGTIFASRKLSHRDILAAIAIFVNGAKGVSALQLSRDLDVQYKTAFVMAHKLREAMGAARKPGQLSGVVEADAAYFGGYIKPANYAAKRVDRRKHPNGKRQAVVAIRERYGRTLPFVFKTEAAAVATIAANVAPGSTIHTDEADAYNSLSARFLTKRINHSECYSDGEACTNWVESYFSRLRRAEVGTYHHIAGPYLASYACEIAWREDHRRASNGAQYLMAVAASLAHPVSRQWKGYWQRRRAA
jgi:transposase-like protein